MIKASKGQLLTSLISLLSTIGRNGSRKSRNVASTPTARHFN